MVLKGFRGVIELGFYYLETRKPLKRAIEKCQSGEEQSTSRVIGRAVSVMQPIMTSRDVTMT